MSKKRVQKASWCSRKLNPASIFEYIEVFYNRKRAHSFLGYLSPEDYERSWSRQAI
jgi:putative transposase